MRNRKDNCPNINNNSDCLIIKQKRSASCRSCSKFKNFTSICSFCNKIFKNKSDTSNKFCSQKCYRQSDFTKGKNNPMYGISPTIEVLVKRKKTMDKWSDEKKAKYKKEATDRIIKINKDPKIRLIRSKKYLNK